MGSTHRPRPLSWALLGAAALALTAGCSAGAKTATGAGDRAGTPATLDELATRTGCNLAGKRKAAELQQGNCTNSRGRYVLVSFTTDQGRDSWLTEAKPWGGQYLVGPRWVAVGTQQTLESLRKDLGGKIVAGDQHGGSHTQHGATPRS